MEGPLLQKSKAMALAAIDLVRAVRAREKEFVLTNQFIRAATNPGAMAREARHAESRPDFIHKLAIAKKEAEESGYWFELLHEGHYLDGIESEKFKRLHNEVMRILTASLRTNRAALKNGNSLKK